MFSSPWFNQGLQQFQAQQPNATAPQPAAPVSAPSAPAVPHFGGFAGIPAQTPPPAPWTGQTPWGQIPAGSIFDKLAAGINAKRMGQWNAGNALAEKLQAASGRGGATLGQLGQPHGGTDAFAAATGNSMVRLASPDGTSTREVPAAMAQHYISRGARRL